jgi:hypothetical protein
MRKSRRDFLIESRKSPFELTLDNPPEGGPNYVTFLDPNKLKSRSAFQMGVERNGEKLLRYLLSPEEFEVFWAEWGDYNFDEVNLLIEQVMDHYGASTGKSAS